MTRTDAHDEEKLTRWATIKDRLAISAVIILLLVILLMAGLDAITNFQCSAWQFITFECNRFDADFKPWK